MTAYLGRITPTDPRECGAERLRHIDHSGLVNEKGFWRDEPARRHASLISGARKKMSEKKEKVKLNNAIISMTTVGKLIFQSHNIYYVK